MLINQEKEGKWAEYPPSYLLTAAVSPTARLCCTLAGASPFAFDKQGRREFEGMEMVRRKWWYRNCGSDQPMTAPT